MHRVNRMNRQASKKDPRYPKAKMSTLMINQIRRQNPTVVMLWSTIFPGFGHLLLCRYLEGSILILWEFFINYQSHLNHAIVYSFTGRFEKAKEVIDSRWGLIYIMVYFYCIWDSRRVALDLNKLSIMADRSNAPVDNIKLTALTVNYLSVRRPWTAAFWSLLFPGLGQIYTYRLLTGAFLTVCWVICCYYGNVLNSVIYFFEGSFAKSVRALDPQWLMFMPSIYGFSAYDAFSQSNTHNALLRWEQSKYLEQHFQQKQYKMPAWEGDRG